MDERVKWFLTGIVAACTVFLGCVAITTAILIAADSDDDARHTAPRVQSERTGQAVLRGEDND